MDCAVSYSGSDYPKDDRTPEEALNAIEADLLKRGYRRFFARLNPDEGTVLDRLLVGDKGVVEIERSNRGSGAVVITFAGSSVEEAKAMRALSLEHLAPEPDDDGSIYLLNQTNGGDNYTFQRATVAVGMPVVTTNYAPGVLRDFEAVCEALTAEHPEGRLAIFDGEPGTGKTHLVQALIHKLHKKCRFVLIPPGLIASMSTPALLPALQTFVSKGNGQATVFLLEDADECLVTRQSDNAGAIAALLNLSDGLLGFALNLRVVATTNAKKLDMDPAILREGRLIRRIEVGALSIEQAWKAFHGLFGGPERVAELRLAPTWTMPSFSKACSLAHVYAEAKKCGWKPEPRKKRVKKGEDLSGPPDDYLGSKPHEIQEKTAARAKA